ncbi:hypothetical protein [Aneurinibacillus aneurinilyticus]
MRYHYCPKCGGVLQASDDLTDVGFLRLKIYSNWLFLLMRLSFAH